MGRSRTHFLAERADWSRPIRAAEPPPAVRLRRLLLLVGGVPLRPNLALLLGGQLGAVLVADVSEARTARHVLAARDPAAHIQPAPTACRSAGDPRGRLIRL